MARLRVILCSKLFVSECVRVCVGVRVCARVRVCECDVK